MILPAYSFALALIALLGYMAIAAGVKAMPEYAPGFQSFGNNFAVPALILHMFPARFAGLAFAVTAIGALVPAAIMSIACASLNTRNIHKEFIAPGCTPAQEAKIAKIVSVVVKFGALLFVLELQTSYAIELQIAGRHLDVPDPARGTDRTHTRFFHPAALLAGEGAGIAAGTWMAWTLDFKSSTSSPAPASVDIALLCGGERAGAQYRRRLAAEPGVQRGRRTAP